MMPPLNDLYKEVIIDHNRSPRNFRKLDNPDKISEGFNPLCGDRITLYIKLINNVIDDISFDGSGCAISIASASLMTDSLIGKSLGEAIELFQQFQNLIVENKTKTTNLIGKLAVLSGVRAYPARIKCAMLSWHALNSALQEDSK